LLIGAAAGVSAVVLIVSDNSTTDFNTSAFSSENLRFDFV